MAGGRTGRRYEKPVETQQQVALRTEEQPARLPVPTGAIAHALAISVPKWKLLTDTVYPSAKTVDGILQAVAYCHERNLDVMKRPVHVVPMYNSALGREVETVWPGIGELRTTATRTGQWAGTDEVLFGPTVSRAFQDEAERSGTNGKYIKKESCPEMEFPLWAQVTVYKIVQGQRVAFIGPKVLYLEAFAGMSGLNVPNAMWRKRPFGQLEKCAEAAALRRAFPEEIGDQYAAEEMEGREWLGHNGGTPIDVAAEDAKVAAAAAAKAAPSREASAKRVDDEAFVNNTRNGLATCTAEQLNKARRNDDDRIEALDDDLRVTIDQLYDDARKRLGINVPTSPEDIAAFKAQFLEKLKLCQTDAAVADLVALEADNLDALPDDDDAELGDAIELHRDNLTAVSGSSDGETTQPSGDKTTGSEEN